MPFSKERKLEILNLINEGKTYQFIESNFNIPMAVVLLWMEQIKKVSVRNYPDMKISARMLLKDIYLYPNAYQHQRAMRFKCSQQAVQKAMTRLGVTKDNKWLVISTLKMTDIDFIMKNKEIF